MAQLHVRTDHDQLIIAACQIPLSVTCSVQENIATAAAAMRTAAAQVRQADRNTCALKLITFQK
jgi:hypothetical protein